jgi:hypothetical protein
MSFMRCDELMASVSLLSPLSGFGGVCSTDDFLPLTFFLDVSYAAAAFSSSST